MGNKSGPVDTHVHLNMIEEPETAIKRAKEAGLGAIVGVGMDLESNRKIQSLSKKEPGLVLPAYGAHPWNVRPEDWLDNLAFLEEHIPGAAAVGEVGLDYKVKVKKELQVEVFAETLRLAARHDKPALVHARYSQSRCLRMLMEAGIKRAVFHWYSGPLNIMDEILAAGYHVSATPALAYSPPHQDALAKAPLEKILVETDAPVEYQGRASEPVDVLTTITLLANLRNMTVEEAERVTTRNAATFFGE